MIICLLIPLSAVSASDVNTTLDDQVLSATPNVDTLSANVNNGDQDNDTLSVQSDENVLGAGILDSGNNMLKESNEDVGSFTELNETINNPNVSNIKLTKNYIYNEETDSSFINGINITKSDVIINGLNFYINGSDKSRIFNIFGDNVLIKNLNIINGYSAGSSGVISWYGDKGQISQISFNQSKDTRLLYWTGANGIISSSNFYNARAIYSASTAENLLITNSAFKNIKSTGTSLILVNGYETKISNCIFENNTGLNLIGSLAQHTTVEYSKFFNNTVNLGGYACVKFDGNSEYSTVNECLFENNTGSSVNLCSFYSTVYNSNFTNNHVKQGSVQMNFDTLVLDNCRFINNTATDNGAGISASANPNNVLNSYFEGNNATSGAAIYSTSPNMRITNCVFKKNTATNNGGAVNTQGSVENSIFEDNQAKNGGAISFTAGDYGHIIVNSKFKNNNATSGGAVYSTKNRIVVDNSTFESNTADNGGVIYNTGNYYLVNNSKFNNNIANNLGGVIYNTGNYFSELNNQFNNNIAQNHSSLMYLKEGINVAIQHNDSNVVNSTNVIYMPLELTVNSDVAEGSENEVNFKYALENIANGGTIYVNQGTYNPTYTLSTNSKTINIIGKGKVILNLTNTPTAYKGSVSSTRQNAPVFIEGPLSYVKNIIFTNDTYNQQLPQQQYGVLYGTGNQFVKIYNCTFDHTGSLTPGGRYWTIEKCIFTNNEVYSYANERYRVQYVKDCTFENNNYTAVYILNPQFEITGCEFIGNNHTDNGAAIYLAEQAYAAIVSDCTFKNNNAGGNGTIYSNAEAVTFENCTFDNNNASYGAAIYTTARDSEISGSTFEFNNASNDGGAVYTTGNYIKFKDSYLYNNTAGNNGGALYSNGAEVEVDNSEFIDNKAGNIGGAIYNGGKSTIISDSIFLRNEAEDEGGAVYSNGSESKITNCTFENNTASNGSCISVGNETTLSIDKSDFKNVNPDEKIINVKDNGTLTIDTSSTTGITDKNTEGSGEVIVTMLFIYVNNYNSQEGAGTYNNPTSLSHALTFIADNGEIRVIGDIIVSDDLTIDKSINITGYLPNVELNDGSISFSKDDITIKNMIFDSASLMFDKSNIIIDNCSFSGVSNNFIVFENANVNVTNSNFTDIKSSHLLVANGDNTLIKNCTFSRITGDDAILVDLRGSDSFIVNNNFTDNVVDNLVFIGLSVNNRLSDCSFINNTQGNDFVVIEGIDNSIVNCSFLNNNMSSVVKLDGKRLSIVDSNFTSNSGINGSAVFVNSNADLVKNIFSNNTGVNGGAVFVNGSDVTLRDSLFEFNNATLGGAVFVNGSGVKLVNVSLFNNTANVSSSMGSAVYVSSSGFCDFDNVTLYGNYVWATNVGDGGLRGDIYIKSNVGLMNVNYGDKPYKQYYSIDPIYWSKHIYINMTGQGNGLGVTDARSNLDSALDHILDNGFIYFMDDDVFTFTQETLDKLNNANLTNVTFVGNGHTIKRATDNKNKYLFIFSN